jgi:hypothetical protein
MIFPAENPPGAVVIYLEIDNRKCEITRDVECFSSATGVRHRFFFFTEYIYLFCVSIILGCWIFGCFCC